MTSLPKGYVIPRLKAGQHSVVVRDGQNRAANAAAGCDSWQQLFAKNVDSYYRARCKILRIFMTQILIVSDLEHDQLAKGIWHPKAKSWPSICCAVTDKTEQLILL